MLKTLIIDFVLTHHTRRIADIHIHPRAIAHITQTDHADCLSDSNGRNHLCAVRRYIAMKLHMLRQIKVGNNEPVMNKREETNIHSLLYIRQAFESNE